MTDVYNNCHYVGINVLKLDSCSVMFNGYKHLSIIVLKQFLFSSKNKIWPPAASYKNFPNIPISIATFPNLCDNRNETSCRN